MPEGRTASTSADAAADDAPPPFKPEEPTARDLWDAARQSSPPELEPDDGTGDIDLHGDSKQIWQDLAKIFGLDCVFDGDYQPTHEMRFRLKSVDYRVAMRGLEAATGTFVFPITSKVFMVAKDTPQKRTELQPRVAMSVALPDSVTQQDFNQAVTAVQQAVGIEKIAFDTQSKTVILRDTPVKVAAARAMLHDLTRPPAQVMVQLKMIEVTRNDMVTYGIDFPTLFSLNTLTNWLNNQLTLPTNVSGFLSFGGKALMGLGIISCERWWHAVCPGRRAAICSIPKDAHHGRAGGDYAYRRPYPVLTSQYEGPASFTAGGTAYTPPPSFQFVDLGLTLKVTPAVRSLASAMLDVDAEYKVLTGASSNGIPVIGNRALKSNVNLRLGEWAVIGGLMEVDQARSIAGLAGVSRIPYLGALTAMHTKTGNTDQILLLMRAYPLSRYQPADISTPAARIGWEARRGSFTAVSHAVKRRSSLALREPTM